MARYFETWLKSLIDAKFPKSNRAFIRAADPHSDEDTATSYLSKVLKGERPAPIDKIDGWARALGLDGDEKALFFMLAALSHAPGIAETEYLRTLKELRELRRAVQAHTEATLPRRPMR